MFGARAGARGTQRAGGIACLDELHQLDVAPRHLEEGSDLLEDACRRAGAVKRRDERPRTRARTFDSSAERETSTFASRQRRLEEPVREPQDANRE